MSAEALPMFPLGGVLFPGRLLPLHVFEPRYRRLVEDCIGADDPDFGVVLIERGSEVGGGDRRHVIGCVARILRVEELGPGRLGMVTVGTRRIRVRDWLPDDPYPRAVVDRWPDDAVEGDLGSSCEEALRRTRRSLALAAELGEQVDGLDEGLVREALARDPALASHLVAAAAPLGPADHYRLLCAEDPGERFRLLVELLDDLDDVLRFRLAQG